MIGRLVGIVAGLAIFVFGFGIWKPALAAKYEHFLDFAKLSLNVFDPYRPIVAFLIMAVGLVVGVAAVQREETRRRKGVVTVFAGDEEPAPAAAASDGHGHGDHGHDSHGHGDAGHGDHAPAPAHH